MPAIQMLWIELDFAKGKTTILGKEYKLDVNQFTNYAEIRLKETKTFLPGKETYVDIEVDQTILQNDKENYHMIVPANTIKDLKILETPNAVVKEKLTYIMLGNRLDKVLEVKKRCIAWLFRSQQPKKQFSCYDKRRC